MHRDHRFHVLPIENSAVSSFGRKSARRKVLVHGNNVGLRLIGIDLPSAFPDALRRDREREKVENNVRFMRLRVRFLIYFPANRQEC